MRDTTADDVGLAEVASILWRGKRIILAITLAFTGAAGLATLIVPNSYTASSVVVPVSSTNGGGAMGGLGALASQFGGLASLAGVAVPGDLKKSESLAVLQSESLTEKYIRDNDLLPVIFRSKWDQEKNRWKMSDSKKIPTPWLANDYFKKKIRMVSTDAKSGIVTVSITWTDPKVAATWANDLVKLTNEYLRAKAIREAEANIAYLSEQALKTDVVTIKQGIYVMLQGEINKVMLAKGNEDFALKVIDPAVAPEKPASPQPVIWILFGFLAGLFVSVAVIFYGSKKTF